jgi:hypothetical protein
MQRPPIARICRLGRRDRERGAALLLALLTCALLGAMAATVLVSTSADLLITGSQRASLETMYVVEAGMERAIGEIATLPDWTLLLGPPSSNLTASFDDGAASATAPDGRPLAFAPLTASRQASSDAVYGSSAFGADSPVWRLFAHAPIRRVLPAGLIAPPGYVLIWVADDGGDGDGDPQQDSNGQLLLHADAYGVSAARRGVEVALGRAGPGAVRVLSWKDTR